MLKAAATTVTAVLPGPTPRPQLHYCWAQPCSSTVPGPVAWSGTGAAVEDVLQQPAKPSTGRLPCLLHRAQDRLSRQSLAFHKELQRRSLWTAPLAGSYLHGLWLAPAIYPCSKQDQACDICYSVNSRRAAFFRLWAAARRGKPGDMTDLPAGSP